jgi:Ca2+-binding EF-hand superfamily protein
MRNTLILLAVGMLFLPTSTTNAQEEERPRRDGEMRERMIEEFDADGDGELNDEERQTARETMRERRGGAGRGEGRGPEGRGRRPEGQGPDGREGRGPESRDPEGRGDRPAPPDPNALFDEFDADKDGKLSREEFTKLTETRRGFMRGGRPPRGPRDSVSREGGDRPGPPPERRDGEFDRQPPLQNQVERPDGPPRGPGEGRRGPRGEGFGPPPGPDGPEGRGPGRGPGGRGPEGQRGLDANRLFDRFDADGDDQLSREEFTTLAERLQEMRERMGDAAGRRGGGRGGEYGPPGRGGRPPRPQRPGEESPPPAAEEDAGSEI